MALKTITKTSDAQLVGPVSTTRTSDAYLIGAQTWVTPSDAEIVDHIAGQLTLTSDALLILVDPGGATSELKPHFQCPVCVPCIDPAEPTANYSTEDLDVDHVFAYGSSPVLPRIGGNFNAQCQAPWGTVICVGTSQESANECLEALRALCTQGDNTTTRTVDPNGNPTGIYFNFPATCTVDCPDGGKFTYTVPAGRFVTTSFALSQRLAIQQACSYARDRKLCLGSLNPNYGTQNVKYKGTIEATGKTLATFPFTNVWTIVGGPFAQLPAGLVLSPFETPGLITGTPTKGGEFNFRVRVQTPAGDFAEKNFTLIITPVFTLTPNILSAATAYFDSGTNFPAGNYRISYVEGAYKRSPALDWATLFAFTLFYNGGSASRALYTADVNYPTIAQAEAATQGSAWEIAHNGGTIGIQNSDTFFPDNISGNPSPTFSLIKIPS